MLDEKKKARLNEIGKEIASMYCKKCGSFTFDISFGQLKGIRAEEKWRPEANRFPAILQKGEMVTAH